MNFYYSVFGLVLQSDIELPELRQCPGNLPIDIRIERSDFVAPALSADAKGVFLHVEAGQTYCWVEEIGHLHIEANKKIVYQTLGASTANELRPWLLILSLLSAAHGHKRIPLHVATLRTPGGLLMLTGASGAGKSTVSISAAARFGWEIMCDDLAVLHIHADDARIYFPTSTIKLYKDVANKYLPDGVPTREQTRFERKYHYAIRPPSSLPLSECGVAVLLGWSSESQLRQLSNSDGFSMCMNMVQAPYFAKFNDHVESIRSAFLKMLPALNCFQISRSPESADSLNETLDMIEKVERAHRMRPLI